MNYKRILLFFFLFEINSFNKKQTIGIISSLLIGGIFAKNFHNKIKFNKEFIINFDNHKNLNLQYVALKGLKLNLFQKILNIGYENNIQKLKNRIDALNLKIEKENLDIDLKKDIMEETDEYLKQQKLKEQKLKEQKLKEQKLNMCFNLSLSFKKNNIKVFNDLHIKIHNLQNGDENKLDKDIDFIKFINQFIFNFKLQKEEDHNKFFNYFENNKDEFIWKEEIEILIKESKNYLFFSKSINLKFKIYLLNNNINRIKNDNSENNIILFEECIKYIQYLDNYYVKANYNQSQHIFSFNNEFINDNDLNQLKESLIEKYNLLNKELFDSKDLNFLKRLESINNFIKNLNSELEQKQQKIDQLNQEQDVLNKKILQQ